jgi:hypothetical protein
MLGPFILTTDFPGFNIASIEAWAGPATEGLPTFDLVHERIAPGFGAVETRLMENEEFTTGGDASWALARLQLFPKDGQRAREFVLEDLYGGVDRVDHVPWGAYDVKVVFSNGAFVWPPEGTTETILVSPEEPALVVIDIRHLGSILIDVFLPAGDQYRGNLTLDLGEGEPIMLPDGSVSVTGGNPISFRRGPYLVKGLEPNTYSVKVRRPLSAQPDYRPLVVPVFAGEVSVLQLFMKSEN